MESKIPSILIPFDASPHSYAGLSIALNLSTKLNMELEGLFFRDTDREIPARDAENHFKSLCEERNIPFRIYRADNQPADETILNYSTLSDLLVLGTKTYYKNRDPLITCDTHNRVTKDAFRPILLIPEKIDEPSFDEAVIATDGSSASWKSIQIFTLLGLAKCYTKVTIISVMNNILDAEKITSRVSGYLSKHKVNSIEKPIEISDKPWRSLLGYMESTSPQLLVMGVYGTGGFKEFFKGSFTSQLIQNSPIPMFTCR